MSLDVYLEGTPTRKNGSGIFLREDGQTREVTREEWDTRFPGVEPVVVEVHCDEAYNANITHNLGKMAEASGIYMHLWRPEEIGVERANDLVDPLSAGLERLKADPDAFRAHNPPNGWGNYEGLVRFVTDYLAACRANPNCVVGACR